MQDQAEAGSKHQGAQQVSHQVEAVIKQCLKKLLLVFEQTKQLKSKHRFPPIKSHVLLL